MVTSYLMGGEGNILFQSALAIAYSKEHNDECAFDFVDGYFTQKPAMNYRNVLFRNLKDLNLSEFRKTAQLYQEPYFHYKEVPKINGNILFYGYFQSWKYFDKYREDILNQFLNDDIINPLKEKCKDLLLDSLSIHVRRGDYLNLQNHHPCPNIDYYLNAIKKIDEIKTIKHILVFSDDIIWCKETFKDDRITFIEGQKDYEDLYLMSLCENNIIANSSFSWWGSYLNKNENKVIIAPKIWFGPALQPTHNWNDIYLEKTITI